MLNAVTCGEAQRSAAESGYVRWGVVGRVDISSNVVTSDGLRKFLYNKHWKHDPWPGERMSGFVYVMHGDAQ